LVKIGKKCAVIQKRLQGYCNVPTVFGGNPLGAFHKPNLPTGFVAIEMTICPEKYSPVLPKYFGSELPEAYSHKSV
jgi:hypothetical protein